MKRILAVFALTLACAGCGPSAQQKLDAYYKQSHEKMQEENEKRQEQIACLKGKLELVKEGRSLQDIKLQLEEHGFNLDCSVKGGQ
jgi:hypothetical protein